MPADSYTSVTHRGHPDRPSSQPAHLRPLHDDLVRTGALAAQSSLLRSGRLDGRANGPVRAATMQLMQQAHGNNALRRAMQVQRQTPGGSGAGSTTGNMVGTVIGTVLGGPVGGFVGGQLGGAIGNAVSSAGGVGGALANVAAATPPAEDYVVPFDRSPKSLPGEEVLFNDVFTHATPAAFQLVYHASGGSFGRLDGGNADKTVAGLNSGNLPFFIDSNWNGTSPVTVQLQVQRISDRTAVRSYTWTFSKKTAVPTTIRQVETEGDRPLPSVYSYVIGPHVGPANQASYEHDTILERFEAPTCNISPDELKPEFRRAHPGLTSVDAITNHFWPGGSGSNGTFTVDADDKIFDQHGGGMPDKSVFEEALIRMKEIHNDLPQIYEAKPGVPLGRFLIRRIMKPDGSTKLNKIHR